MTDEFRLICFVCQFTAPETCFGPTGNEKVVAEIAWKKRTGAPRAHQRLSVFHFIELGLRPNKICAGRIKDRSVEINGSLFMIGYEIQEVPGSSYALRRLSLAHF
jgi:hypothetical protein